MYKFEILQGRLTADPELAPGEKKDQQNGSSDDRCSGTIAVGNVFNKEKEAQFFRWACWGHLARLMAQYGKKGKMVLVSGDPQSTYLDDPVTNTRKYYSELRVEEIRFGEDAKNQRPAAGQADVEAEIKRVLSGMSLAALQELAAQASATVTSAPAEVPATASVDDDDPFPA